MLRSRKEEMWDCGYAPYSCHLWLHAAGRKGVHELHACAAVHVLAFRLGRALNALFLLLLMIWSSTMSSMRFCSIPPREASFSLRLWALIERPSWKHNSMSPSSNTFWSDESWVIFMIVAAQAHVEQWTPLSCLMMMQTTHFKPQVAEHYNGDEVHLLS